MFPEEFIKRISTQKYLDADGLLGALREESPVSIRINKLKWDSEPENAEAVPWCSSAYYLVPDLPSPSILCTTLAVIIPRKPPGCLSNR